MFLPKAVGSSDDCEGMKFSCWTPLDPRQRFMVGDEIYSYAYQRQLVGMVAVRACS